MNQFINKIIEKFKKITTSQTHSTSQSIFNIGYLITKNLFIFIMLFMILISITIVGVGVGFFANIISHTDIPSETVMKAKIGQLNQSSSLLFSDGELISEVQSDVTRKIISSNDISDYVKKGLIATEDNSFYEHSGIVPKSMFRAILQEIFGASNQTGGSTLTQQLVKQQLLTNEVTFSRKAKEMLLALRVEKYFSKDDILTSYLNVSPFGRNSSGQNIAGIEAAAQGIFGVSAKDLSLNQAAFLVGLPQAPYAYTPYTYTGTKKENMSSGIARMKIVLHAMKRDGYITEEQYNNAINYDITQDFIDTKNIAINRQSYLYQTIHREAVILLMKQQIAADGKTWEQVDTKDTIDLYNSYYKQAAGLLSSGGYRVFSTIEKSVYNSLQDVAKNNVNLIDQTYYTTYTDPNTKETKTATELPQVGLVVIENSTGKILGFVGGSNFEISQTDHAFTTRRSPGSTIKPLLVYAPAIENQVAYPATLLADFPINRVQNDGTIWSPTNASGSVSNSFVTLRHALTQSLNNPTIHLYSAMLAQNIQTGTYMTKMGVHGINQNEYQNEAAAVGGFSSGPTVAEQVGAFTTFANDGKYIQNYIIDRIEDVNGNIVYQHKPSSQDVFSTGTSYIMRSILADSINHGTTRHFKNYLNFSLPQAYGKTGTSDYYRDLWAIVSTPRITVGQWLGYDNNYGAVHNLTINNSNGSIEVRSQHYFAQMLNALNAARSDLFNTNERFTTQPSSVTTQSVLRATGTLPGNIELTNGAIATIDGELISDLFLTSRPPFNLGYRFSPGASDSILDDYWNNILKSNQAHINEPQPNQSNSSQVNEQHTSSNQ